MTTPGVIAPSILLIALRRAVPIWLLVRIGIAMFLPIRFGEWSHFWSVATMVWAMLVATALLFVQERTRWRETVLLGNLGVPRYTIVAIGVAFIVLAEQLLHAVHP